MFEYVTVNKNYIPDPNGKFVVIKLKNQMVLDIDNKPAGKAEEFIAYLRDNYNYDIINENYSIKTPSGGFHVFFNQHKDLKSSQKLGIFKNVDIQVSNQFSPAPGTHYFKKPINKKNSYYRQHNYDSNLYDLPEFMLFVLFKEKKAKVNPNTYEIPNTDNRPLTENNMLRICEWWKKLDKSLKDRNTWRQFILGMSWEHSLEDCLQYVELMHNEKQYPNCLKYDLETMKREYRKYYDKGKYRVFISILKRLKYKFLYSCYSEMCYYKIYVEKIQRDNMVSVPYLKEIYNKFFKDNTIDKMSYKDFSRGFYLYLKEKQNFIVDNTVKNGIRYIRTRKFIPPKAIIYDINTFNIEKMDYNQKIHIIIKQMNIKDIYNVNKNKLKEKMKEFHITAKPKQVFDKIIKVLKEIEENKVLFEDNIKFDFEVQGEKMYIEYEKKNNTGLNKIFTKMYYLYLNKDKHRISVKQMKSFWKSSKYEGKFCNFKKEFFEFIGNEYKLVFESKNIGGLHYYIKEWKTTTTINETKKIEYNYDDSMTYDQKINQIIKELNITDISQINIKDLKIMKKKYKINMLYKQILKKIENTLIENSERIKDQEIQKIQLRFNKMVEPEEINDIKDNIINMPKINKENIIIEEIKERKYA